jgi:hypothetical protein
MIEAEAEAEANNKIEDRKANWEVDAWCRGP